MVLVLLLHLHHWRHPPEPQPHVVWAGQHYHSLPAAAALKQVAAPAPAQPPGLKHCCTAAFSYCIFYAAWLYDWLPASAQLTHPVAVLLLVPAVPLVAAAAIQVQAVEVVVLHKLPNSY
jgi:hypothetical protein